MVAVSSENLKQNHPERKTKKLRDRVVPGINEDYIIQVSEEIEGRVTVKTSVKLIDGNDFDPRFGYLFTKPPAQPIKYATKTRLAKRQRVPQKCYKPRRFGESFV